MVDGGPYEYHLDLGSASDRNPNSPTVTIEEGDFWFTQPIGSFAIRTQECCIDTPCPTNPRWRLANIQIRSDDVPNRKLDYTIQWVPANHQASYKVNLYAENRENTYSSVNYGGRITIATGVDVSAGSYNWNVNGVPAGRYFIHVEITDGSRVVAAQISGTPLRVSGAPPAPDVKPLAFFPLAQPVRLFDSRPGLSPNAIYDGPNNYNRDETRTYRAAGDPRVGIPANARGIAATIQAVDAPGSMFSLS